MDATNIIYCFALCVAICVFCYAVFRLVYGLATGKFKRKKDIPDISSDNNSDSTNKHSINKSNLYSAINKARDSMRM